MSVNTLQDRLAGSWRFAAVHSSAEFAVKYLVAKFRGRFGEFDARLEDGVLTGSAKVASISVKSTIVGIEGDTLNLDGELTIKGQTEPVHATGTSEGPTEDFMGKTRLGFTLETKINRTDFGVSWNAELPKGGKALSDEVTLIVELEFHKV